MELCYSFPRDGYLVRCVVQGQRDTRMVMGVTGWRFKVADEEWQAETIGWRSEGI